MKPPLERIRPALGPMSAYHPPSAPPVKLDANESPWPLPAEARALVAAAVADVPLHRYPDVRADELRAAIAARYGGAPDELVIGAGSDEVIAILMLACARPGAVALFPEPTFVMYRVSATTHGLTPVGVPLRDDWSLDVDAMVAAIEARSPALVFLATPNNPTGNAFDERDVRTILAAAPGSIVVIDEAYQAFAGRSLAHLCEEHPNAAALGTLSKIGLAAARVGWARMHRALAHEVDKARQPYNLNALSQRLACLALGDLAPVLERHVAAIVAERARLAAALGAFDALTVFPSQANFLWVRVDGDAGALCDALRGDGVGVRAFGGDASGAGHVRVTVGTPGEDDRLLAALPAALAAAAG